MSKKFSLPVKGMTCASCAAHVGRALKGVEGVTGVKVNLATERAVVEYDPETLDIADLVRAVQGIGYDVPVETVVLPIGGMTCASCVVHVEKALKGVEGVLSANVNLATEKATVTYIPGVADMADFKRAVADVGYEVVEAPEAVPTEGEKVDEAELKMREARFRMRVAWAFTAPIILWMFAEMFFGILWPNATVYNLGMVVLALPVLF